MKICIESQPLNHNRRSGLMTYTEGLINSVYQQNTSDEYQLAYYSLKRKADSMPGPSGNGFTKVMLRVPDWDFPLRNEFLNSFALPEYFKKNKIDVFHRPNGYNMPSSRKVFKVLTVHDLRTLTIGDTKWSQNIDHYHETLNRLDVCVVVSECTKRDMIEHFHLDERKIKVVYLAADERFRPLDKPYLDEVRKKYNLNEKFLLSIGSVPRKNIDGIIRAFAGCRSKKDYILVLGCNQDLDKYTELAKTLNILERIRFLTDLTDGDIVAMYNACHCFVFPSLYEGFGLPIVEAMQCGAPVITSNVSACPEVAGDAAVFVDPNDVQEIGDAIDQICKNEHLRTDFIRKGFERSKLFNWDQYAVNIRKIYATA